MSDSKRDIRTIAVCAVGIIAAVMGIAAYLMPWAPGGVTGLDLLTGNTDGLPSGFQGFLPTVSLALMAVILVVSIMGLAGRGGGFTSYGAIIFGFIALAVDVVFANWTPYGEKLMVDGGTGMYLGIAACCLFIFAGIAAYMVRPRPVPPAGGR